MGQAQRTVSRALIQGGQGLGFEALQLTQAAGQTLQPVLEALYAWGVDHYLRNQSANAVTEVAEEV